MLQRVHHKWLYFSLNLSRATLNTTHGRSALGTAALCEGRGGLELPGRNLALVELVKLPVGAAERLQQG